MAASRPSDSMTSTGQYAGSPPAQFAECAPELPSLQISQWWAIVAPARTPSTVVTRLGDEVRAALANPQTKARLDSQGIELKASSPAQLGDRLRGEVDRWAALVKQAGIQPE